jgi:hypothetical protein
MRAVPLARFRSNSACVQCQWQDFVFLSRFSFYVRLKLHNPHFPTLLIWMNDPPPISFKTNTEQLLPRFPTVLEQHRYGSL